MSEGTLERRETYKKLNQSSRHSSALSNVFPVRLIRNRRMPVSCTRCSSESFGPEGSRDFSVLRFRVAIWCSVLLDVRMEGVEEKNDI